MQWTSEIQNSKFYLLLIIVTSLMGDIIYLKVASLYQFVFLLVAFLICYSMGMEISFSRDNQVVNFFLWMTIEAAVSIIWAPDKGLAAKYTYYVMMLFLFAYILDNLLTRDNLRFVNTVMVIVLFVVNLIGVWETITNHHLHSDYLSGGERARILAYVPGGFFMNPNDFATYIIQILPFSLITSISDKSKLGIIAISNIFLSFYVIIRTESRTQLILILILLAYFLLISMKRRKAIQLITLCVIGCLVVLTCFPSAIDYLTTGLNSISTNEIAKSSDGGSLGRRIALLQNGIMMVVNTFGFGVGAGCHRVLMKQYSQKYVFTGKTTAMHNILGEIFADYGAFIGVYFIRILIIMIQRLNWIAKTDSENSIEAKLFIATLGMFLICGIASSSIIQQTSIWVTFCYIGAFIRVLTESVQPYGRTFANASWRGFV